MMAMHKILKPRNAIGRLYVSRKEGGRELASVEEDGSTQGIKSSFKRAKKH